MDKMTRNAHRRRKIDQLKTAAKLAFIFGLSLAVCGLVIYICSTIILCPP
jgi:hypothetical protein